MARFWREFDAAMTGVRVVLSLLALFTLIAYAR
jgi:hypothetical protein